MKKMLTQTRPLSTESMIPCCLICLTAKILQNLTGDSVEFYIYIYVLFIPFEFTLTKGGETKHELHIKNQVNSKTKSSLTSLFGDEKTEKNRHNTTGFF